MEDDNPFVINAADGDVAGEGDTDVPVPAPEGGDQPTVEEVGNVEDLIPLCVKHANGPQINAATFGYDIAQMERRPWAEPGARQSDFFNYGFNETSWRLYCAMQSEGAESLLAKANEMMRKLQAASTPTETGAAAPPPTEEGSAGPGLEGHAFNPPMMTGGNGGGFGYNASAGGAPYDRRGGYRGAGAPPPQQTGADTRMFYKTKLCQRFAEGRCTRGSDCNYAHGISELRSAPPATAGGGAPGGYGVDGGPPPQPQHHGMGGGYVPMQQPYGMGAFHPGANMGPMPAYDAGGGEGFHGQPKRQRGDGDY